MIVADWAITVEDLAAAPKLRMIQHQGVGHERIDKQALKARGVPLALCPAGTTIGVAEHTILLILAVYKRLVVADTKMRQGTWLQWGLRSTSFELCGKTLGLVGFGRIGQAVAKRAHAFDAKILYHDAFIPTPPAEARAWGVESVGLDDLLRRSDIVSVHVPTTDETRNFMNAARFAQMKRSAVFINTSRGAVVDEPALIRALQDKVIAGAGLDVFEKEPIRPENPLLAMDNVILTPHIPRAPWTPSPRRCKPSLPICSAACAVSPFTTESCDAYALRADRRGLSPDSNAGGCHEEDDGRVGAGSCLPRLARWFQSGRATHLVEPLGNPGHEEGSPE